MVTTFSEVEPARATLFPYLTPCSPAPGIAAAQVPNADLRNRPSRLSKRRGRLLSWLCGTAQAAAFSLGLWVSALPQPQPVVVKAAAQTAAHIAAAHTAAQQSQDDLWDTLGSDALAQVLLAAQEKQAQAALSAAKHEQLQAQQLRLDAEAQAQNLTTQAAEQARQKTVEAMRQVDLIALDATYLGAEQVLYAKAGDDITLKFAARIQCKAGQFGDTAVATPVDPRITPREVRNLAVCFPSAQTPTGKPIGQAGSWGVPFFKLE